MAKKRKGREEEMYPVVKQHFLTMDCTNVVADLPGESWKPHIPRNDHFRYVDVIAVEPRDPKRNAIHIAEGKRLTTGHAFEECVHQLNSVRTSADFLWAFLPRDQWANLSEKDTRKNLSLLRKHGMGLILVDVEAARCDVVRQAVRNQDAEDEDRRSLLAKIGLGVELRFPFIEVLGTAGAQNAMRALALMCAVEFIFRQFAPWTKKRFTLTEFYDDIHEAMEASTEDGAWFVTGRWFRDDMSIDLDPFGLFLEDGVPVVWIFQSVTKERLLAEKGPGQWTHWFVDEVIVPVGDVTAAKAFSDSDECYLARRIEIMGRAVSDVKRDLAAFLGPL
jgi:hypothetical protein